MRLYAIYAIVSGGLLIIGAIFGFREKVWFGSLISSGLHAQVVAAVAGLLGVACVVVGVRELGKGKEQE